MSTTEIIDGRKVIFTNHARERMLERNVSEEVALAVLRARAATYPAKKGRLNIQGTVNSRLIRVTVREDTGTCTVITVVVV